MKYEPFSMIYNIAMKFEKSNNFTKKYISV